MRKIEQLIVGGDDETVMAFKGSQIGAVGMTAVAVRRLWGRKERRRKKKKRKKRIYHLPPPANESFCFFRPPFFISPNALLLSSFVVGRLISSHHT